MVQTNPWEREQGPREAPVARTLSLMVHPSPLSASQKHDSANTKTIYSLRTYRMHRRQRAPLLYCNIPGLSAMRWFSTLAIIREERETRDGLMCGSCLRGMATYSYLNVLLVSLFYL
jgi:hypothetical protein